MIPDLTTLIVLAWQGLGIIMVCVYVIAIAEFKIGLRKTRLRPVVMGLAFGIGAALSMLSDMFISNLMIDGRNVLIGAASAFGGPLAGLVALVPPILVRAGMEDGTNLGVAVAGMTVAFFSGLVWRSIRIPLPSTRWTMVMKGAALGLILTTHCATLIAVDEANPVELAAPMWMVAVLFYVPFVTMMYAAWLNRAKLVSATLRDDGVPTVRPRARATQRDS